MVCKLTNKFISKSVRKLYLNSTTADVHFSFATDASSVASTVKVPAHKAILAIANPVFEAMFFGQLKENDVVEIVDANASAFKELLQLFYLPEVTFTMENIESVVRLADKYDMTECFNSCAEFLEKKLSKENVIWAYQMAISMNNRSLKLLCENHIKNSTNEIFKSDPFFHCDKSVIEHILRLDLLGVSDVNVFEACVEWAKVSCHAIGLDENDPSNLREQLDGCLQLIRFGEMSNQEIGTIMSNEQYKEIFNRNELADILCMTVNRDFKTSAFKYTPRKLKWNSNNDLECILKNGQGNAVRLQGRESTWFSSNVPVLLGKIECVRIGAYQDNIQLNISLNINMKSKITIFEFSGQSNILNQVSKIVYVGTLKISPINNPYVITLAQPVMIHPNKIYEIRFDALSNVSSLAHYAVFKPEVNLGNEVLIKIHRHPSDSTNQRGFVFALHFNRI